MGTVSPGDGGYIKNQRVGSEVACSTDPGSHGLCQHVLQPSGKLLILIKRTACFHGCTLESESWGEERTAVECWWRGACQLPAAFCHRAVVAGRRNSAVPVAAGGRMEEQPGRWLLQQWAGCSFLSRAKSWSMLTSNVGRAFISSPAPLRGDCSIGARVLFFSAVGDWQEAASAVPE